MFNKIKRILGISNKTDKELLEEELLRELKNVKVNVTVRTVEMERDNSKSYDLSMVLKNATKLKKDEGHDSSIDYLIRFIDETSDIDIYDLLQVLEKLIPYIIKVGKLNDNEIKQFIIDKTLKFKDTLSGNYKHKIALMLKKINLTLCIEYLESEYKSKANYSLDDFEAILLLSDCYLELGKTDLAFRTLSSTQTFLLPNIDTFKYLRNQIIYANTAAQICWADQISSKYANYLFYIVEGQILEIAKDISSVANKRFQYKKSIFFEWHNDNNKFDEALANLNMLPSKNDLLKDIYHFSFFELPELMGLPLEYLNEDFNFLKTHKELSGNNSEKAIKKRDELNYFLVEFPKKPFNLLGQIAHFSQQVTKKYYDLNNNK